MMNEQQSKASLAPRFPLSLLLVEDNPAAGGRGGRGGRGGQAAPPQTEEAMSAEAEASFMKMANDAQKSDLDALSRAMGYKTSNYLIAKPKARAGSRPRERSGASTPMSH